MMSEDLTRTILACEQARCDALLSGDMATLADLLSERLIFVHANATSDTKKSLLAKMSSGAIVYRKLVIDEERILDLGSGSALLSARLTADLIVRQAAKQVCNLTLSVWTQEGGVWRLLAYQPTPLPT